MRKRLGAFGRFSDGGRVVLFCERAYSLGNFDKARQERPQVGCDDSSESQDSRPYADESKSGRRTRSLAYSNHSRRGLI